MWRSSSLADHTKSFTQHHIHTHSYTFTEQFGVQYLSLHYLKLNTVFHSLGGQIKVRNRTALDVNLLCQAGEYFHKSCFLFLKGM